MGNAHLFYAYSLINNSCQKKEMNIEDVLNKTCLIGLSYINTNGDLLKQAQYAGTVITVDKEEGITIKLDAVGAEGKAGDKKGKKADSRNKGTPNFHIPASLDTWFIAPKGHYKNAEHHIYIVDPDYFVIWDVAKKKDDTEEGSKSGGYGTRRVRRLG